MDNHMIDLDPAKQILQGVYRDIVNNTMKKKHKERTYISTADYNRIQDIKDNYKLKHKKKLGRNDLCPCGSGLKFKRCCGK